MEQEREYHRLIEGAICKINDGHDFIATAFTVNQNYLISTGHAFMMYQIGTCFKAKFLNSFSYRVKLIENAYSKENAIDYAILKFEEPSHNTTSLPISFPSRFSGNYTSAGYGETLHDLSSVTGKIIGSYYINDKEYLLKACSGQAGESGFSGSPIFSLEDNSVIAVQCEATIKDIGSERDTILAFPFCRFPEHIVQNYLHSRPSIHVKTFIEEFLLPSFGRSLLCLEHSDNLDAYMRCIIVKLLYQSDERCTVFVAKNSNDPILPVLRRHHKTRKLKYGIVGGMIKANVPIIYDFLNDKCYQLDLGGTSKESNVLTQKTKGAKENRIALLVAPIRDADSRIIGVLSFDFFPVQNPKKNIVEIIKDPVERGRILYMAELYAQTLSQILLKNLEIDIDFLNVTPDDL